MATSDPVTQPNQRQNRFQFQVLEPDHSDRAKVEQFIQQRFLQAHGALITQFMPTLLAISDTGGQIKAASGIRGAADERLFLESYMDQRIESLLNQQTNADASTNQSLRAGIVEVGNLAAVEMGASRQLFIKTLEHCREHGFQWMVFTSCARLRIAFKRLNLNLIKLISADESRLNSAQGQWGSYYSDDPSVMAWPISEGPTVANRYLANRCLLRNQP